MIDGTQLLTVFAMCFYIGIGIVIGFIAGLILIPSFCVVHPLVKSLWEHHRTITDIRKREGEALKVLVDKMREARFDATKEVLKEHLREEHLRERTAKET